MERSLAQALSRATLQLKPLCIIVESIVLRLFKKLPKTGSFRQFFAIFAGILAKTGRFRRNRDPNELFRPGNLLLLMVNQQRLCAIGDGVLINDYLGNILLVRQVEHHIQQ